MYYIIDNRKRAGDRVSHTMSWQTAYAHLAAGCTVINAEAQDEVTLMSSGFVGVSRIERAEEVTARDRRRLELDATERQRILNEEKQSGR